MLSSAVDSVADLVPESVPRPVAKGGVAVVGALVAFGLLKQVMALCFPSATQCLMAQRSTVWHAAPPPGEVCSLAAWDPHPRDSLSVPPVSQVVSGIFTLVVLGGVGYWWLTKQAGGEDDDFGAKASKAPPSSSSKPRGADLDDPLADAQRIMDKYK